MEDWREVKPRSARAGRPVGLLVLLAVLVVFVLGVVQPRLRKHDASPSSAGDPRAMELARLKMLGRALRLHADEHDGKFPAAISEINWRQNMPGMDWNGLPAAVSRFHNPETGKVSDWLYFAGHTGERSAGNDPGRRAGGVGQGEGPADGRARERRGGSRRGGGFPAAGGGGNRDALRAAKRLR